MKDVSFAQPHPEAFLRATQARTVYLALVWHGVSPARDCMLFGWRSARQRAGKELMHQLKFSVRARGVQL